MQKKKIGTALLMVVVLGILAVPVFAAEKANEDNTQGVDPSCYIQKVDYDEDSAQIVKDGEVVTLAGIYAQVRGEFVLPPCTTDPHLTWYAADSGDITGALVPVYAFDVVSHDWRGASVDAYGAGLGRTWHAFAEVSLG
jgi:hypothetical protein